MEFEWDEEKTQINLEKHKVSFEESVTVFHDLLVATMSDPDHSDDEQRYIAIGQSAKGRILIISYTERQGRTRIISCRKATPRERKTYEEGIF
ncbi:MAG: BrnT family toxin [Proteobacteria bacterium]|nr:BrnT family toxin [Desulfobacterales bacterium]MBU1903910.1 BrnT family toxin [Pseudomonadota bacterium]